MEAYNRIECVMKLRSNTCQDFLKLVLLDGWQQLLYDKAKEIIDSGKSYKSKYENAYRQMRRAEQIENYSVYDMDMTLMYELVNTNFEGLRSIKKSTKKMLTIIKNDRNLKDHYSENEKPEVLYLYGLLALANIRAFITTVHDEENSIDDENRRTFYREYSARIDELQEILDEERIELIQERKAIEKDIQRVLNSDTPMETWLSVVDVYEKRVFINKPHDWKKYNDFIICASNEGVIFAHTIAVIIFAHKKDFSEAERRVKMAYNAQTEWDVIGVHKLLDAINTILQFGGSSSNDILEMVNSLRKKGFDIITTPDGLFQIPKKKRT